MAATTWTKEEVLERAEKTCRLGGRPIITPIADHEEDCAEQFDITLPTHLSEHHITVRVRHDGACSLMATSVRRGNGGRDIADGPANEATWSRIMQDIVSFEIMLHG